MIALFGFFATPAGRIARIAALVMALGIAGMVMLARHDGAVRATEDAALAAAGALRAREVMRNAEEVDEQVRHEAAPDKALRDEWSRPDEK